MIFLKIYSNKIKVDKMTFYLTMIYNYVVQFFFFFLHIRKLMFKESESFV